VRCPTCNADNQTAAKFCVECGAAFNIPCAKCGFQNPPIAKFCQECGKSLKPGAAAQQLRSQHSATGREIAIADQGPSLEPNELNDGERKMVTALFADLRGSTELMEDLDPEEAIKRVFLQESLNQPLIVIFEDLHWIDSQTQVLLDLLTDSIASVRILLLVNFAPNIDMTGVVDPVTHNSGSTRSAVKARTRCSPNC